MSPKIHGGEASPLAPASSPMAAESSATPLSGGAPRNAPLCLSQSNTIGTDPSDWPLVELQELATEITVGFVGSMASEYVPEGIPFLRSQNIDPLSINLDDLKFITPDFHRKIKKSRLSPGDVVIVRTGKPGSCAVVPDWLIDANCSDIVIVRCGSQIDNHFLSYYVNSAAIHHISAHIVGAVQQHFNVGAARTLKVKLPPLPIQKAIAHILGTLDDRIELCRRMNETLEAMARALFKDWFIDFGPVRAKMEGREPPGLSPEIAALFPSNLVDSELGEIPEGWEISTIGEEVRAVGGGTPSTKESEFWDNGCHFWATPKDLSKLQFPVILETERKITDAGLAKISSGLLPTGALLLSSRAPIGYLAIAEVPMAINQGFIAMICDRRISNIFAYFWCKENMDRIIGNANGSTFQEISKSNFRPLPMIVPSKNLLNEFSASVTDVHQQIVTNQVQVASLSTLRDTLLPKLLSGELTIPEAMLQVEAVP